MSDSPDPIPSTTVTIVALIIVCGIIFLLIRDLRGHITDALMTVEGWNGEKTEDTR